MFSLKKMSLLAIAITALGTGSLCAYTHNIKNSTESDIRVYVQYAACKDEKWIFIPAHQTYSISAGACILQNVQAKVYEKQQYTAGSAITGTDKEYTAVSYNGPYTGSATWIVAGPFKFEPDNQRYVVTRSVQ